MDVPLLTIYLVCDESFLFNLPQLSSTTCFCIKHLTLFYRKFFDSWRLIHTHLLHDARMNHIHDACTCSTSLHTHALHVCHAYLIHASCIMNHIHVYTCTRTRTHTPHVHTRVFTHTHHTTPHQIHIHSHTYAYTCICSPGCSKIICYALTSISAWRQSPDLVPSGCLTVLLPTSTKPITSSIEGAYFVYMLIHASTVSMHSQKPA